MKQLSPEDLADFNATLDRAKEIVEEMNSKLREVNIVTKSAKVVDAVNKVFGILPDSSGKITITYEMYSTIIEKMRLAGSYKAEEFR